MKQGKNPTRRQKILISKKKLNSADWLVVKDDSEEMVLQHRHFDSLKKTIHKGGAANEPRNSTIAARQLP